MDVDEDDQDACPDQSESIEHTEQSDDIHPDMVSHCTPHRSPSPNTHL